MPQPSRPRAHPGVLTLAVLCALVVCATLLGGATALAARILHILGFYEVLAALTLSVLAVAFAHMLRWRPAAGAWLVALGAALAWLAADRTVGAWAFREEQAKLVVQEAHALAEDFLVSGADTPMGLVDLGFRAETGVDGLRGAWLTEWNAGQLAMRAGGLERRLPPSTWLQAVLMAATVAFLTLVIRRSLQHLGTEPVCPTCDRYLTRTALGRVGPAAVPTVVAAWQEGRRDVPESTVNGAGPVLYRESCAHGHTTQPGYALVQFRGHTLGAGEAGLVARLTAQA